MDTIDQLWRRIAASLGPNKPMAVSHLSPGSSERALADLEEVLGAMLPDDFRASYRLHNGGLAMQLVTTMELLPIRGIAESWSILEELLRDEEWAGQLPYYFTEEVAHSGWQTGPIQAVWWHRRWIPFASDSAGNLSCLDLAPALGGAVGQIIDWDHECGPSRVLFPSFGDMLAAVADQIEHGSDSRME